MTAVDATVDAVHHLAAAVNTGQITAEASTALRCQLLAAADQLDAADHNHPLAHLADDCLRALDKHGSDRMRLARALAAAFERSTILALAERRGEGASESWSSDARRPRGGA